MQYRYELRQFRYSWCKSSIVASALAQCKMAKVVNSNVFSIHDLIMEEIAPCIISESITEEESHTFAGSVISRFSNPCI